MNCGSAKHCLVPKEIIQRRDIIHASTESKYQLLKHEILFFFLKII